MPSNGRISRALDRAEPAGKLPVVNRTKEVLVSPSATPTTSLSAAPKLVVVRVVEADPSAPAKTVGRAGGPAGPAAPVKRKPALTAAPIAAAPIAVFLAPTCEPP